MGAALLGCPRPRPRQWRQQEEQERHDDAVDHNQVGGVIGHVVDDKIDIVSDPWTAQEWADWEAEQEAKRARGQAGNQEGDETAHATN